jgi:hypothetical protein
MELKQKYTEEELELDEFFLTQINKFSSKVKFKIAQEIDKLYGLPVTYGHIKQRTGVVHNEKKTPVFFAVDYLREKDSSSHLLDIYEISLNSHLDSINLNTHIK